VDIFRLGGFDIYLSSSSSSEIAVGKGARAKGGVQRERHEGEENRLNGSV
jgi:hypothetical protein